MNESEINNLMRPEKLCLCKGVSKNDIERTIDQGANSLSQVIKLTKATTGCGTCYLDLKEFVELKLAEKKDKENNQKRLWD